MRKSLGNSKTNRDQLHTLLIEIEAVINSRPLIYIDADINSSEALTPSHFLSINSKTGVPNIYVEMSDVMGNLDKIILKTWKSGQEYLNKFWNIWASEYLKSLRETHTLNLKPVKGEVSRIPRIGEVVIIKEEGMP